LDVLEADRTDSSVIDLSLRQIAARMSAGEARLFHTKKSPAPHLTLLTSSTNGDEGIFSKNKDTESDAVSAARMACVYIDLGSGPGMLRLYPLLGSRLTLMSLDSRVDGVPTYSTVRDQYSNCYRSIFYRGGLFGRHDILVLLF
jgi:hypothetical protein